MKGARLACLAWALLGSLVWGAESFEEFEQNTLRLLGTRQYTYLADYFKSSAPALRAHARLCGLAMATANRLPRMEHRLVVLAAAGEGDDRVGGRSELLLEWGQSLLLSGDSEKAAAVLGRSREANAKFYRGEAFRQMKDFDRARVQYEGFLEKGGDLSLKELAHLALASLALDAGRLVDAGRHLGACDSQGVETLRLKLRLSEKRGETAQVARLKTELQKKYPDHERLGGK